MNRLASLLLAFVLAIAAMSPAHAHRVRVFATVEQGAISGYAYFVGGGRAKGASVIFRDAANRELHRAVADPQGAFRWKPEKPQTIRIVVDAGDGHVGSIVIDRARLAGLPDAAEPEPGAQTQEAALAPAQREMIEAAVDEAVARHTRPLLEAFESMETRLRFNDIVGGIGMIIGVAGAALWAASRRKGGAA